MSNTTSTRIYQLKDISPEKVVASPVIIETETQNKYNVHHNLAYPQAGDVKNNKNGFELQFPMLITSSVNATTSPETGYVSFHIYADVYGNYPIAYQKVCMDIDKMLERLGQKTSAIQFKDLLLIELVKKGVSEAAIEARYKVEITNTGKEFTEELFRYLATAFLIDFELLKDEEGTALAQAMKALKECYCTDFDSKSKQVIKQKIYAGLDITKKLPKPSSTLVDDIVKWQALPKNDTPMSKLIDYSKSPQIHFKIMESIPKPDVKVRSDAIILSDRGQVLWAKIYNYMDNLSGNLMKSYEEFDTIIYRKGENLSLGKSMFNLHQKMKTVAPSVYWSQAAKRGEFQFKVIEAKVFEKIERQGGARTIPADERDRDIQEARASRERLGLGVKQEESVNNNNKRNQEQVSGNNSPNYYHQDQDDMDALIDQQEDLQQDQKKRKYY